MNNEIQATEKARAPRPAVITVRLPAELHGRLKELAHQRRLSLNVLCVQTLQDFADLVEEIYGAGSPGTEGAICEIGSESSPAYPAA